MKKLITFLLTIFFFFNLKSQNVGYLGKKHTIETSLGLFYRKASPYVDILNNFKISRSLSNNLSISGEFSFSSASKKDMRFTNNGVLQLNSNKNATYRGVGIYFNLYGNQYISPIGRSFSLYAKYHNAIIDKFKHTINTNNFTSTRNIVAELNIQYYSIGIAYNSQVFVSNNNNLFLRLSVKTGIPFGITTIFNKKDVDIYRLHFNDFNAENFYNYFQFQEYFQLNFGIGYIL